MAKTYLKVTTDQLKTVSGQFSTDLSNVTSTTDKMLSMINGLNAVCNGDPYDQFIQKAMSLQGDMEQIKKMITGHQDELLQVAGLLDNAKDNASTQIQGLPTDVI